jgi:hypothetical protein
MKDLPNEPIESAQPFPCCNRPPASLEVCISIVLIALLLPITAPLGVAAVSAVSLGLIGV